MLPCVKSALPPRLVRLASRAPVLPQMWVPGGQRPLRAQWGAAVGPRAPSADLIRNCGPGRLTPEGPPAQDPHLLATCGELAPPPQLEPENPKMALLTLRPSSSVSERLGLALGDLPGPLRSDISCPTTATLLHGAPSGPGPSSLQPTWDL